MPDTKIRPHGTWQRYRYERCRCTECVEVFNARRRARARLKARQQWGAAPPTMVDAEPVRQHVRSLMAQGMGRHRVAKLAGVSTSCVGRLLYGWPGGGKPPTASMRADTAQRLLAVSLAPDYVDGTGTRRRLQALAALGWSGSELMRRLDRNPTNWNRDTKTVRVRAQTADAVRRLYNELWDVPPPMDTPGQRQAASRARRQAMARGWLPPLAWDDDTIDVPAKAGAGRG